MSENNSDIPSRHIKALVESMSKVELNTTVLVWLMSAMLLFNGVMACSVIKTMSSGTP